MRIRPDSARPGKSCAQTKPTETTQVARWRNELALTPKPQQRSTTRAALERCALDGEVAEARVEEVARFDPLPQAPCPTRRRGRARLRPIG